MDSLNRNLPKPQHNHPPWHTHPKGGVPWKYIAVMMQEDKFCPRCHVNHLDDSPRIKFRQDVRYPALASHGCIFREDVTASAKVLDIFNNKSPKITYQDQKSKPVAKRVSDNSSSGKVSARRVHPPSISNSTLDSNVPTDPIEKNVLLIPNRVAPIPTSNRYNNLYSLESDDDPVFKEMVSNFITVRSINTYSVVPQLLTLASTPDVVLKKQRKIIVRKKLSTIKRAQSDTTALAIFLSTTLH